MPDINMQVFEEAKRNQLVTEVDIQTQVALDDYQVQLSDIANPTQSHDNVMIDRFGEFLPHWNESLDFDTWVKISMEVAGKRLLLIHGNVGLTSKSSITDTMIFGDDFNSGSVPDSTKWTTVAGGLTVSSGNLIITGTTGTRGIIEQNTANYPAISQGVIIESKGYANQNNQNSQHFCSMRSAGSYNDRVDMFANVLGDLTTLSSLSGTYEQNDHSITITANNSYMAKWYSGNAKYYHNDVLKQTHTTRVPTVDMVTFFTEGTVASSIFYIDWVFVRQYTSTEPTYSIGTPKNISTALKSFGRAG